MMNPTERIVEVSEAVRQHHRQAAALPQEVLSEYIACMK